MRQPRSPKGDEALLTEYLETFRLPDGVLMDDIFTAFARVASNDVPGGVTVGQICLRSSDRWTLDADIVRPRRRGAHPVLVFVHGGGWTSGTPTGFRTVSCELARRGFIVVVPDYRRAPRDRFPAAFDDCRFAIEWVAEHAVALGGNSKKLVVAGDSAGANLAAAALISLEGNRSVAAALFYYGIYDFHATFASLGSIIGGPSRTEQLYLPVEDFDALRDDPRVNPLLAAEKLPPTYLVVGSADPLMAQTVEMAGRLEATHAGRHRSVVIEGAPHGFLQLPFHPALSLAYDSPIEFALGRLAPTGDAG